MARVTFFRRWLFLFAFVAMRAGGFDAAIEQGLQGNHRFF